jgi:hypothetical protein
VGAVTDSYEVGAHILGVHWSADDFSDDLRRILGDTYRTDTAAPPNFGVVVGSTTDGVVTKHSLYRANRRVLRTASSGRVLRAIVRGLGEHAMGPPEPHEVDVSAIVVIDDGKVTLIDSRVAWVLDDLAPRLASAGCAVIDTGVVRLDLDTGEVDLTLPEPWHDIWTAAEVVGSRRDRAEARNIATRYPLETLIVARLWGTADTIPPVVTALGTIYGDTATSEATVQRWLEAMRYHNVVSATGPDDIGEILFRQGR